jgi:hypothetical protein
MKKFSLLFLFGIGFLQTKAQTEQEKLQIKNIVLQAYESVSQSTRQWLNEAIEKHPAGDFDTAYAMTKLRGKFSKSQLTPTAELWVCMMALQKMMAKEARGDRKIQPHFKRLMLADKAEKLKMQNEAIDQGVKEAREKADRAMDAATTNMVTAIVSGLLQVAGAASSFTGQEDKTNQKKDTVKPKTPIRPVSPRLSLADYIRKLERQLAIVKKQGG